MPYVKPAKVSRLVYLAAKLASSTPSVPRQLTKYFPEVELIEGAKLGAEAASDMLGVQPEQLRQMYKAGKRQGVEASADEFRVIVGKAVQENIEETDLAFDKKLGMLGLIDKFVNGTDQSMILYGKTALGSSIGHPEEIEKWKSGFKPLDLIMGGMYQGILVVMAPPGSGKTTIMLVLAQCIKKMHPEWPIWFFEQEIPERLMLARMAPLIDTGVFTDEDTLVTGGMSIHEIVEELGSDPTHSTDRIVFIDSPDSMPGMSSDNRRFELGYIYRELVRIKERSRLVVVASQPRRKNKANFTLQDVAESWEKAWYADMMIGIWHIGDNRLQMKNLKNRFGPGGKEVSFDLNLETLEWGNARLEEDWG